jgi:hypothetical protein
MRPSVLLKRDYAEYEATYKIEGNVFTAGRKLTLRQDELPVSRTGLRILPPRRGTPTSPALVGRKLERRSAVPPADMKADDLVDSARAAAAATFPSPSPC